MIDSTQMTVDHLIIYPNINASAELLIKYKHNVVVSD